MKLRCSIVLLLCLFSSMALAQQPQQDLDYVNAIKNSSMVFIPRIGHKNRGPVFFTKYHEKLSNSSNTGELRRMFVFLEPDAFGDGSYKTFTNTKGIIDDKTLPIPQYGKCEISSSVQNIAGLITSPDQYKPQILPGNWPTICMLSVYFYPEDEEQVTNALGSIRSSIILKAKVPICKPDSDRIDATPIINALMSNDVVKEGDSGDLTGNLWDVLYESVNLSVQNPNLFGGNSKEGWEAFFQHIQINTASRTVTIPSDLSVIYLCNQDYLELH